jgi:caa(3)-type oxidase subunit IV
MSESHATDLRTSLRRCGLVLLAVACTTSMMICASYSHLGGWPLRVAAILAVAAVNAFLVAGFLMHLLTEKKLVLTVLLFTVCFFIGLMGLTVWAAQDFPTGTTH